MRLHTLIEEQLDDLGGLRDCEISSLTADSRQVREGALFVAVRGTQVDGHRFLKAAVESGAHALVGEEPDPGLGVPYLQVDNSRLALARLAAAWHGHPARELVMIGVTGTDGKTTTANLLYQILRAAGIQAGLISTVNAVIGERVLDTGLHVTTPDPLEVQGYLREMLDAGLTHCILEATSHGLAQHRVGACDFDLGIVTNITHEHLDYHGSYQAYRQAKGLLFSGLSEGAPKSIPAQRTAILNRDDPSYSYLREITKVRTVSYGLREAADVIAEEVQIRPKGLRFTARGRDYEVGIHSHLVGAYNVSNCLAAFTAGVEGLGLAQEAAVRGVAALAAVPGRMEAIDLGQPFAAIVDFAHTPNALRGALEAARSMTAGRVIAVFGSAGLRDREKRRMMAEIGADLADLSVLTAEDPRTESLEWILEQMAAGAMGRGAVEGEDFRRVPDRGEAIRLAVREASPEDVVIVCGKGHEQSMCFGETEYPWDDRVALRAALSELLGVEGPAMPELPTGKTG